MTAAAERLLALLVRPSAHRWLAVAAVALVAPALGTGLVLDDHVLALGARAEVDIEGLGNGPFELFRFTSGKPEDNRALMDEGVLLPWWSDEQHLNAFFRPLSSLSHVLDFRLFPNAPWLMHLHNLLWLWALVLVVAHVLGRIEGARTKTAALALLLFCLDEAHAMTAGWIANRNALIAATLALPALAAHHRMLTQSFRAGRVLGPLCFLLGLCAGETALAVLGYLIAYTLVLDKARLGTRALRLLPYFAIVIGFRLLFAGLELGSKGSGAYHDPLGEPIEYGLALLTHLPILIGSVLGPPVADLYFWGGPEAQAPLLALAGLSMLGVLALAHVLLRGDEIARFWMVGMLISGSAVAASVPGERLLLVPSLGGAALLARLLIALLEAIGRGAQNARATRGLYRAAFVLLVLVHVPASLVGAPARASALGVLESAVARVDDSLASDPEIRGKTVVVMNAPFDALLSYVQVERAWQHRPRPEHLHWLATASSDVSITRSSENTLEVSLARGFLLTAPERHYRGDPSALARGSVVRLSRVTLRVLDVTADGRPKTVEARFDQPLEAPELELREFRGGRLEPFELPALGQTRTLEASSFFEVLREQAARP